jgi:hypothetical protein
MNSLHTFFDNTKQLHTLLAVALFLLVLLLVLVQPGFLHTSGHLVIVGLLAYILYTNFNETRQLQYSADAEVKKNALASYVLCVFILLLILYIMYSLL